MFTESDSSDFVSSRQMGVRSRGGPSERRPSPSLVPRGPAGRSLSSLFFSLGIRDTLVALTESPGLHRRIVAYLDDIVIFSTDPSPLDDVFAFFDARASSLHWNKSKWQCVSLEEIREGGMSFLGTFVGQMLQSLAWRVPPSASQVRRVNGARR